MTEAEPDAPRTGRPVPRRVVILVVGLVGSVVASGGVAWWLDRENVGRSSGAEAAERFVQSAERGLDATYRLEGDFTRTLIDGRELTSGLLVVQRAPDRLQRSLGSTAGVVGGRSVNCGVPVAGGRYTCAPGAEVEPWPDRRSEQVRALQEYVLGDDPVYVVTETGNDCFALVRRRPDVDATYGSRAELCFDRPTGALRRLEVEREGGAVDVLAGSSVTGQVDNADFDLSADDTYDPQGLDGG